MEQSQGEGKGMDQENNLVGLAMKRIYFFCQTWKKAKKKKKVVERQIKVLSGKKLKELMQINLIFSEK